MDFSHKIDKDELREIFQRPFDSEVWKTLLMQVFGANKLYTEPKPRELDNGDNAKVKGYDLGEIITPDKYTIGLFQFEIKEGHKIPMNRVGLRGLVERDIKYFYDAALVVYYNDSQWRLSFICDLRDEKTAPKRFTYVFGDPAQYYRTPISRFEYIKTNGVSKKVIHDAFSVEALNKDFYKFIAGRFYELVGATTGAGKNKTEYKRVMRLPSEQDNLVYQEFAVRLIGRTVFCWFLKEKKSKDGVPLLPHALLSSKALNEYKDYYHTVLERIFFQTLNTPNTPKDRVKGLPKGCELIPFLNGGLFDYRPHDFYAPEDDGLSKYRNELQIPDEWFKLLFEELEQYNFTIDENSPDDIEVSVDPEMLGRIFENLLAEIDPDSGETARKATGSFYTPREIVDYMAIESLVYYLNRKTGIDKDDIYPLFKSTGTTEFSTTQRENLLVALDELKILDPACGSGAFPMGVLAKITGALKILDEHGEWWKERQLRRIDNAKIRQDMQDKLNVATVDYARKIGIIQNTLYGVDIQPIAAEISKLRCFLTLIVDENVDDSKPNRGVDPLPNLEFKFITADSLLKLPPVSDFGGLFGRDSAYELTEKLRQLRIDYLQSYGNEKKRIKKEYLTLQNKLGSANASDGMVDTKSREYLISEWNPFTDEKSDWFDPEWMFGVTGGFDIVIGNPPYISLSKIEAQAKAKYKASGYKTFENTGDIYALFYERGSQLLKDSGVLSFITSRQWMQASYGKSLRKFLAEKVGILQLIDFGQVKIFEGATVFVDILTLLKKGEATPYGCFIPVGFDIVRTDIRDFFALHHTELKNLSEGTWSVSDFQSINEKIEAVGKPIKDWREIEFNAGIKTAMNVAFHISEVKKDELITADSNNSEIIKPLLRGKDIKRYEYDYKQLYLINTHNGLRNPILPPVDVVNDYPTIYEHLCQWQSALEERLDKGEHWTNLRNCAFLLEFEKPKIVWIEISDRANYAYDDQGMYLTNSAYFLTTNSEKIDLKYLLALLNSKVADFYFSQKTAKIAGGRKRYTKQYVEQIPIPYIEKDKQKPFVDKADEILATKATNPAADTSALESEIDRMVYDLYGLTPEEIVIIEQ